MQSEEQKLAHIKTCFEQGEKDLANGLCVDGETFMDSLNDTYCKTKDGKIHKIWSNNIEEKTMHVYRHDEHFDAESTVTNVIRYDDIERTSDNLESLQ